MATFRVNSKLVAISIASCLVLFSIAFNSSTGQQTIGPEDVARGIAVATPYSESAQLLSLGYLGDICDDVVNDIALDSRGSVYIVGYSARAGSGSTETCISTDVLVAKLDATATEILAITYFGGDERDYGKTLAVDDAGNVYVGGITFSTEATFPVLVGPDLTSNGSWDGFVAKLSGDDLALEYLGYIGGADIDYVFTSTLDADGYFYVAGMTDSTEETFPVVVGPDITHNGDNDGFIAKVAPDGSSLEYAGYFGGSAYDLISDMVLDSLGSLYITGETASTEATFPAQNGPDLSHNGEKDAFVAKLHAETTAIEYAGYIGGELSDASDAVAVDIFGNVYVAGYTMSDPDTFPVLNGPSLVRHSSSDAFVASVTADGSLLRYAGYIGGDQTESVGDIAVDRYGHAFVIGHTASDEATFPLLDGPDLTHNGGTDTFISRVKPDGSGLTFSGYVGGEDNDIGNGLALDALGNAYFCGHTNSAEDTFPVAGGPDLSYNGWWDGYVGRLDTQEQWIFLPLIHRP